MDLATDVSEGAVPAADDVATWCHYDVDAAIGRDLRSAKQVASGIEGAGPIEPAGDLVDEVRVECANESTIGRVDHETALAAVATHLQPAIRTSDWTMEVTGRRPANDDGRGIAPDEAAILGQFGDGVLRSVEGVDVLFRIERDLRDRTVLTRAVPVASVLRDRRSIRLEDLDPTVRA